MWRALPRSCRPSMPSATARRQQSRARRLRPRIARSSRPHRNQAADDGSDPGAGKAPEGVVGRSPQKGGSRLARRQRSASVIDQMAACAIACSTSASSGAAHEGRPSTSCRLAGRWDGSIISRRSGYRTPAPVINDRLPYSSAMSYHPPSSFMMWCRSHKGSRFSAFVVPPLLKRTR